MAVTDKELAARSAGGDHEAFSRLVDRYEPQLSAVIRSHLRDPPSVEDVRQEETLIQAWQGIVDLRDPSKVKQWLTTIARNRCRDFLRSAKRREQLKGVAVDRARRIVVDGVRFVHWYDGLSGAACL